MYNIFRQIIPHINDPYKKIKFIAIYDSYFYVELIIMIGSRSISFSKFKKVRKRKTIYFQNYHVALDQR